MEGSPQPRPIKNYHAPPQNPDGPEHTYAMKVSEEEPGVISSARMLPQFFLFTAHKHLNISPRELRQFL